MAELETQGTPETEQAKGLDAILDAAIEQHSEEPKVVEETPTEPKSDGKSRDERGKFIAKDKSTTEAPVTGQAEVKDKTATPADDTAQAQPVVFPDAWSADWKAKAATLPPDQQNLLVEQYKAMQGSYTQKSQELAQQRKEHEPLLTTVNKWNGYFQQVGMTPDKAIEYLLNAEYMLRTGTPEQKQAALAAIVRDYGLSQTGQQPAAYSQRDPEVADLRQRLSALQDTIENSEQQKLKSEIDAFSQAKDQNGQILHPHFDRVRETMGRLLDSSQAIDLETAYAKAVRLDDELFKQTVESERKRVADEADKARQEAVDKAKRAQPTRSSDGSPKLTAERKGLDAHLDAALEQFAN